MKKIQTFCALLCAAFIVACSNEDLVQQSNNKQITMTATDFEYASGTRTSINVDESGGNFTWAENDTVGIFPDQGGQVYFPMIGGAGTKTASFDGGGWALKPSSTYAAYYPYYILNNDLSIIGVSYEGQLQQGNASTASLGKYDFMAAKASTPAEGNVNFHFSHLGCLVELNLNFSQSVNLDSLTMMTDVEAFVSEGLIDLTADVPTLTPVTSSTTLGIKLSGLSTTSKDEMVKVYLMMAPYDLSGKAINVKVEGFEGSFSGNNMKAGMAYKYNVTMNEVEADGANWVDLGLSVKWAAYNIGATKPEEYGNFYAWGEISTKTDYTQDTSITNGMNLGVISGNAKYDAATALWGTSSRMPTKEELQELLDNCTNEWVSVNGVPGCKFTSKKNGNSIFLPAAGRKFKTNWFSKNSDGRYWSGSPYGRNDGASCLRLGVSECRVNSSVRGDGFSIRPVKK